MSDDEMIAWYSAVAHRHGGRLRAAWMDAWCLLADEDRFSTFADETEHPSGWIFFMVDRPCEARHPGWPMDSLSVGMETGKYKAEMTIADMDESFMRENTRGFEYRKKLSSWMRAMIEQMIL